MTDNFSFKEAALERGKRGGMGQGGAKGGCGGGGGGRVIWEGDAGRAFREVFASGDLSTPPA